jgi:proline dehydrogenase
MEDFACLEPTLHLLGQARGKGYKNVGVAIQSYLYRSKSDVKNLLKNGITIRLVKGAYKEAPEIAYPKKQDVDSSFDEITSMMLDASLEKRQNSLPDQKTWPPIAAIGSHDEERVRFAEKYANQIGLSKELVEFQMLYGIRRDIQNELVKKNFPVRVYVPFGSEWYPYFMRRLAERPANLWFFVSNLIRK